MMQRYNMALLELLENIERIMALSVLSMINPALQISTSFKNVDGYPGQGGTSEGLQ